MLLSKRFSILSKILKMGKSLESSFEASSQSRGLKLLRSYKNRSSHQPTQLWPPQFSSSKIQAVASSQSKSYCQLSQIASTRRISWCQEKQRKDLQQLFSQKQILRAQEQSLAKHYLKHWKMKTMKLWICLMPANQNHISTASSSEQLKTKSSSSATTKSSNSQQVNTLSKQ